LKKMKAWEEYCDSERPLEPAIRKLVEANRKTSAPARSVSRSRRGDQAHAAS
jgi:hypothetical protein